jgi:phosphate transport system substrate-binding protein
LETHDTRVLRTDTLIAGAYRVVKPIAEGGMGMVYEVEQVATGARRALKVMHGRFADDDGLRTRFVREARIAAAVPTDHVAQVVDAGLDRDTGALFIVMELLEGSTLSQELRRRILFEWSDALAILAQVAHALGAAHVLGIVHRDLKPANVFLAQSRRVATPFNVKLLDFGIAKAVAGSEATAAVLGTPTWMAPEQTTVDAAIGPEADVWSFGLLAFLLLTGRHYFAAANAPSIATAAVLREVILDPLAPASVRAAEMNVADRLPDGFDAWFARCVDRTPSRRFRDARAAFEPLALLSAPSPSQPPSGRLRAMAAMRVQTPITAIETPRPLRALRGSVPATAAATANPTDTRPASAFTVERLLVGLSIFALAMAGFITWSLRRHPVPPPAVASIPVSTAPRPEVRLHGSNTIGAELVPALAEAFLQRRTAKNVLRKRTAPDEMSVEVRDADHTLESFEVFAHGTSTAFDDLRGGKCDIGMASRRIHDDELSQLAPLGNLASAASEYVVALDGIAVIVNPSNPVSTLTKDQIADLFAGRVRRWSEVGGKEAPVVVHARDDRSGTYDTFRHLVLGTTALVADAERHESSEELSDAVAADARAIGFIGLPYVRSAKAVMVQEAGSAPLLPSQLTVSTEDYPLARRLYFYVPADASQVTRDFVDFVLSADGQRLVRANGFGDLQPGCEPPVPCPACTRDYQDLVQGACRVSIDFRFDRGTMQLDTRALRDFTRVAGLMGEPEYRGRGLVVLGFSDGAGARAENLRLSQERASIVAQQFRARGLHVLLERGLNSEMPVGNDATEDGRERNRRVEVWLR